MSCGSMHNTGNPTDCFKGTQQTVLVNIYFPNKGKMTAYYFRRDKAAILGAIKAQLAFSEGKYQLLNSWNKIPFPTIFHNLSFQLAYSIRSNNVSLQKYPFKRP